MTKLSCSTTFLLSPLHAGFFYSDRNKISTSFNLAIDLTILLQGIFLVFTIITLNI